MLPAAVLVMGQPGFQRGNEREAMVAGHMKNLRQQLFTFQYRSSSASYQLVWCHQWWDCKLNHKNALAIQVTEDTSTIEHFAFLPKWRKNAVYCMLSPLTYDTGHDASVELTLFLQLWNAYSTDPPWPPHEEANNSRVNADPSQV